MISFVSNWNFMEHWFYLLVTLITTKTVPKQAPFVRDFFFSFRKYCINPWKIISDKYKKIIKKALSSIPFFVICKQIGRWLCSCSEIENNTKILTNNWFGMFLTSTITYAQTNLVRSALGRSFTKTVLQFFPYMQSFPQH